MQNLNSTILAQYANSPTLLGVINNWNLALDPNSNIDNFYNNVWNIESATGYGLQVWGRIVGAGNTLSIPGTQLNFGFKEGSGQPFGQQSFFFGQENSGTYTLSDPAFRALILAKALTNISNTTNNTYNTLLMNLFSGRGNAYVSNSANMVATLVFEFYLQPYEVSIIKYSGAIQPPTGVNFNIMVVPRLTTFGFAETKSPSAIGFNQGNFFMGYA